jgi:hypothetical protein
MRQYVGAMEKHMETNVKQNVTELQNLQMENAFESLFEWNPF